MIFHKTIFRSGTNLGPFPAMASAVPSQGQQLQPPPSVVPGDSIADSYDPAQVRAANLSRAEALMSQQQRQLPQQQQPSPNTVIQQQHQFQQQVYTTKPTGSFHYSEYLLLVPNNLYTELMPFEHLSFS